MIDLGVLGFRRFCILLIVFLCSSAALYFALSPDVARREYVSVFLVGKRSIDTPIDKPEQLAEYAQLKLLPTIGKEIMGEQWDNVQVVFANKPGSRFIRIITRADEGCEDRVERMHQGMLKALLNHQEQHLLMIRKHLMSVVGVEQERLDSGGASLSSQQRADIKANIYYVTAQLDNLEPSAIVESFSSESVDKLRGRPVRIIFSLLLSFLFVIILVFIYAFLNVRIDKVSVGNFK